MKIGKLKVINNKYICNSNNFEVCWSLKNVVMKYLMAIYHFYFEN